MRGLSATLLLIALAVLSGPLLAKGDDSMKDKGKGDGKDKEKKEKEEKKDLKKELLLSLGKSVKGKDASAIAKHLRTSGKIKLKLKGVKKGDYRSKQALNVLKAWFKEITPTECKLSDHKGTHGKYTLKYKKGGKKVEATLKVFLEKEDKTWRIKGIEES